MTVNYMIQWLMEPRTSVKSNRGGLLSGESER